MEQEQNHKNQRKNFFINNKALLYPGLQMKFIFQNILCLFLFFVLSYIGINLKLNHFSVAGMDVVEQVKFLKFDLFLILLVSFVVSAFLSTVLNLYHTFKIVAPFLRLCRYLKEVAIAQEILPIAFRKGDYFMELPSLLIDALKRIRESKESEENHKKTG
jgi:hypothetical protein